MASAIVLTRSGDNDFALFISVLDNPNVPLKGEQRSCAKMAIASFVRECKRLKFLFLSLNSSWLTTWSDNTLSAKSCSSENLRSLESITQRVPIGIPSDVIKGAPA